MPSTNEPSRRASGVAAPPSSNIAPQDIAAVLDNLAASIQADGNSDIFGPWAVAYLAGRLNITSECVNGRETTEVRK